MKPLQVDAHTHTLVSGHAYGTISEMAKAAAEKGLSLLGITEHTSGIPGTCSDIYFANLKVVPRTLYGVELLLGAELNIIDYDGHIDLADQYFPNLDIRIASIHEQCYTFGTIEQNTAAMVGAIRDRRIDLIGHPNNGAHPLDYEAVVRAAAENHTILEINNHSLRTPRVLNGFENACTMLRLCKKYDVPVATDSDAHFMTDIANVDHISRVFDEIDFPEELILNYNAESFKAFLAQRRRLNGEV